MKRFLILTAIAATLLAIPVTHVLAQSGNSECCVTGRHSSDGRVVPDRGGACARMETRQVGCTGFFLLAVPGTCRVFGY